VLTKIDFARLWLNENLRVLQDKLIDEAERADIDAFVLH
jgi:hypothetical protein